MDSADRIILWNRKCEELLARTARSVLGKPCYEVLGGRDAQGNIYCYRNCPVAFQARQKPSEPVHTFPLSIAVGKSGPKWFNVSLFAIPSYHPALSTVVHVLRESRKKPSGLERRLAEEAAPIPEPLWPITTDEGQLIDLTTREKEILRCLSEGLSTSAIARRLFIAPVTVRNHTQSVLQKLGVHTKLAAVVFAYRNKLL